MRDKERESESESESENERTGETRYREDWMKDVEVVVVDGRV
jgi:hypothetical protein